MMNTDTLVETTWIKNPHKLHAVRFTDWQQVDAIRVLMGADMVRLTLSLTKEDEPQRQFYAELTWYDPNYLPQTISQGDYLVTKYEIATEGDPPQPAEDQSVREWRIMTAEELQAEHQRYRPIR